MRGPSCSPIIGTTLNPESQEKVNKMLSIQIQWRGSVREREMDKVI